MTLSLTILAITDAYLGKLDPQGRIVAEYSFRTFRFRLIESVTSLDSGELVVAGRDGAENWLTAVSTEGKLLWRRRLGLKNGSSPSVKPNIMLARSSA